MVTWLGQPLVYLELQAPGDDRLSNDDVATVHASKLKGVVDAACANTCTFDSCCQAFLKIVISTGGTGLFGKVRGYFGRV